jgi:hypothetical protein
MLNKYTNKIVNDIYDKWKKEGDSQTRRTYLGGSQIGHHCERFLWYDFRHCSKPEFTGRLYRLFQRGHDEEHRFVKDLKDIGCQIWEFDEDGNQFGVSACGGHFKGHTDGVGKIPGYDKPHLLEFKTSNTRDFKKLKKDGVEAFKPVHFDQMQVYMHLMKLERALYMVVCKENDDLYTERVRYSATRANQILEKASRVIYGDIPERCTDRKDSFLCKFCSAKSLCWGTSGPEPAVPISKLSCRQCVHAEPVADEKWNCKKHNRIANSPCDDMLFTPSLVSFAEPVKYFQDHNVIEFKGSETWYHGNKGDEQKALSCKDLIVLPKEIVELPSK